MLCYYIPSAFLLVTQVFRKQWYVCFDENFLLYEGWLTMSYSSCRDFADDVKGGLKKAEKNIKVGYRTQEHTLHEDNLQPYPCSKTFPTYVLRPTFFACIDEWCARDARPAVATTALTARHYSFPVVLFPAARYW